jgi:hypothetical protein
MITSIAPTIKAATRPIYLEFWFCNLSDVGVMALVEAIRESTTLVGISIKYHPLITAHGWGALRKVLSSTQAPMQKIELDGMVSPPHDVSEDKATGVASKHQQMEKQMQQSAVTQQWQAGTRQRRNILWCLGVRFADAQGLDKDRLPHSVIRYWRAAAGRARARVIICALHPPPNLRVGRVRGPIRGRASG